MKHLFCANKDLSIKCFFVQKIAQGRPCGKKIKISVEPDALVFDVLEKSVTTLKFLHLLQEQDEVFWAPTDWWRMLRVLKDWY